jgi:sarcosine oxidase subunit delta
MAFLIECPNCGLRPYTEFWFGGEMPTLMPGEAGAGDEEFERVWLRRNATGVQEEQWFHYSGCRRWLVISRDTLANVVHAVD